MYRKLGYHADDPCRCSRAGQEALSAQFARRHVHDWAQMQRSQFETLVGLLLHHSRSCHTQLPSVARHDPGILIPVQR